MLTREGAMRFASSSRIALATLAATIALAVPLGGCPDEDVCRDYSPPASFDPATPTVSFADDVMPIFGNSCAFSTCHGSATGDANGVFLGGSDPEAVYKAIVDVRSSELPTMSYVKAGDPRESYLMRKMDGSHCILDAQCTDGDCGLSMPRNDEMLPIEARDVVRRWIAQGAKNESGGPVGEGQ
jgi:hypothetical protein